MPSFGVIKTDSYPIVWFSDYSPGFSKYQQLIDFEHVFGAEQ